MDTTISNEMLEAKQKHESKRDKIENSIRDTPLRHVPMVNVPASAQVVIEDKAWYRSFAKISLFSLIFVSAAAAVLSIALWHVITQPPETLSYGIDEDGRVVLLEPIRNPSLTETQALNWASEKITQIHSLNFTDYVDHIQSLRADFTPEAFVEYQKALLSSKSLEKVKKDRLTMWAEPREAPKIKSAKVVNGKYTWEIEMKITQFLAGGEYLANGTDMTSTIVIERTSRARNLAGVVISKYLPKEDIQ